ncbi:hypothetical protein O7606_17455 [Micromonospora sp. WMMD882]|uniref:hypothetical protein n=1 Tax=Micromonospora sp. WMMD882 TaxID=3015151 RepID=UPI00248D2FA1|nr:hypothetical protein [Micromonospora sp. WMMD882]WBB78032.1 hypothetical protein O7606_17455 [Micromonospora sp. WMMD882]
MDDDIWRLPGPARLVADTVREVNRGRHAAVVLPVALAGDQEFVSGLTSALTTALWAANEDPRPVATDEEAGPPVSWLAQALDVDEGPLSTAQLLDHEEAAGKTAVLDCTPLCPKLRHEVAATVTRLVAESRPRPARRRPRLLLVCTRDALPRLGADHSDVTFEALWWWGRLSRWDVAARIQPAVEARSEPGVLRDVRLETLIEVCRWDIRLAAHLADRWDGDPGLLPALVDEAAAPATVRPPPARSARHCGRRPTADLIEHWDDGTVDRWHDECVPVVRSAVDRAKAVRHAVWVAQARVLLPWVETRRQAVAADLLRAHGKRAVHAAIGDTPAVLEVGPLFVAVRALAGRDRPALCDAVYRLREARNKLAHLQALTTDEQRDLVGAFASVTLESG